MVQCVPLAKGDKKRSTEELACQNWHAKTESSFKVKLISLGTLEVQQTI